VEALPENSGRRRRWGNIASSLAAIVSATCAVTALLVARPWADHRPATPVASAMRAVGRAAGTFVASDAAPGSRLARGPVMFALQPRIDGSPRLDEFGPPVRLTTQSDGIHLVEPHTLGPMSSQLVAFGAVRLTLSVASGVLALLSVVQLARLAFASWRGELFSPDRRHGAGLRRLAWLTLLIGLADVCSVVLQIGVRALMTGDVTVDAVVASAAVLASLFLFLFAHAVSEGAKMADDHLHTV